MRVSHLIRRSTAFFTVLMTVGFCLGVATPAATAAPGPPETEVVLLPQSGEFACQMVDDGGARAWVYCWKGYPTVRRQVKLNAEGQVSLSETAPRPTGLGGPGNPPGAWKTVGRFRCEVQKRGLECVVIATGKGFRIQGTSIVEVQAQAGVVEPPPALGEKAVLRFASGVVRIKEPGSGFFAILNSDVRVPVGTVIDTTRGTVQLTSAADSAGAAQTGLFRGGVFRVTQPTSRSVGRGQPEGLTVLRLVGRPPAGCGGRKAGRRGARVSAAGLRARRGGAGGRRLWGNAHGDFQTGGRYASATVSGTKWLTEDTCAGTLVAVARGAVSVEDRASQRTVFVTAGHRYLAHPGGSGPPSQSGRSRALIWRALDGKVVCGVAFHLPREPAKQLLCFARPVPAPRNGGSEGDPGFVYLGATGSPRLARLSQYSFEAEDGWEAKNQTPLGPGRKWANSAIGVTCSVSAATVRCVNRAGHGFTIGASSYGGF